ncbi:MAG: efflux RND transporter periplasmic adaptor subunit [Terriglobales bacterium]
MALQTQAAEELKSKARVWIPIAVIVAVLAMIAAFALRSRPVAVRYATVTRTTISSAISTNGKIEPTTNFEAHAPAATSVRKLFVKEGDHVKAGQMLLQLDDSQARSDAARAEAQVKAAQAELNAVRSGGTHEEVLTNQAELTRAKNELQAAQRNLETMRRLQQTGAASPAEVQDAEARLKSAQTQVNLLQQKTGDRFSPLDLQRAEANLEQAKAALSATQELLAKSNVRSPINGEVYSLPVKAGAFVNAGDLLVQVADLSRVNVRAFVDEPDIGRLSKGQPVLVTWDALPGRTWNGIVTQVPTTVTARGSRMVGEVVSEVDNSDRKLLPNVNVSVVIVTAKHQDVLTVPREAIHQTDGKKFVLEVVNGKLVRRDVETGVSNLTNIEITRGVSEGAKIAMGAYNNVPLREGMKVK